ncbi:4-(cytidine 5'-diphospho)-2-C-methyl-D-erythritol kinase [Frigidibacter albus]|uniref:4-diphosphocytidyl-2-C-methyl-D-erythritol kinase n=1 Tax=Frigidibacter albus TaxID=1465486 RepID=A0A6L8VC22_9RHOB|nr:4-(cytidine 5'-diphospho)-2-C-methyl-D-erythritol kinase [Frigidibacter albus]MZQ87845.1 4-(cytidine 5'-diphospho)-2-C-methyl-D-erythritol kinase [Frigidibacter albus]NBE29751.1 4-(cytidine 5'-diphospho)-2-C-methyl-D-erythritol kinase [Frigidibacter albus]GGH42967.1 4-diphosphocytidyl-2-C-methyl-D-erythritol kinase [Frigidibacter albus]
MPTEGFAPAKVNLALHVTGQRADGYHLLDSLVVFADVGDRLTAEAADDLTLQVTGPRAEGVPTGPENLVLRAARLLDPSRGARLTLDKHLPAAAGIGGGSSDAAAALRVLARLWELPLPAAEATAVLGADVPVCLDARPRRMAGIGDQLSDVPPLPPAWLVLVNPGVPVSTPAVFRALDRKDGAPMPEVPACTDAATFAAFLLGLRNDLEPPARALQPQVSEVLAALGAQTGCLLARMSGSGATCFGLFAAEAPARGAAAALAAAAAGWWVQAARMLPAPDQETRATT